ncbi:Aminoglycoside phosphotransferase [Cupriavidus taiwanensis]|nr:Aminoglycoside phosphotransferase [Cupriavidus taiwanensis]SOY54432.1 Aminoglycoside phosphotransferase [Cupriavidus taiwanensis]SOY87646.1 Aminoglycoside phosphotransferase [Cupriavidus taiwanensis]SOZ24092.1 Aminoglycoside phosphotransferase [Cupriavidus taiwanensis]SOZ58766.1 Aminoglycoside phosphotransferase [Cupriavidus taiwanensis]
MRDCTETMPTATPSDTEASLLAGLRRVIARELPGADAQAGITGLRRLSGGASQETWSFTLAGPHGPAPMILRRDPGAEERPAAGVSAMQAGMAAEAALLRLAGAAGVPVPVVRAMLMPQDGIGEGFVMDCIEGETLGGRIVREPRLARARERLAYQCGQALAAIHGIDRATLPPLRESNAAEEVEGYLRRYRAAREQRPVFELAFRWLRRHAPATGRATLVHGDFRNGNLMVDEAGLRAVLDWELAHVGDPMTDLGWLCVNSWRFGRTGLPVGGFGTRAQLFAGYADAGGMVDAERVRFWEIFGVLKWGVACQTMSRAPQGGGARSVERAAIGRRSSETEIDLLNLLLPRAAASACAS